MATKKPAAKPVTKKAPAKKASAAPVKKAVPAKKAAPPAPKKATAQPASKPVKPAVNKTAKVPAKVAPKGKTTAKAVQAPAKKAIVPSASKSAPAKKAETPVAKSLPAKPIKNDKSMEKTDKKAVAAKPVAKKSLPPTRAKDIKITPAKPVSIPKISTKTSRKYQPDFTQSVLDSARSDNGAPLVRYSDNDLTEFKELIQRKLAAAKKELNYLQGLITRKDEMGGDDNDNRYMTMEDGSLSMEREQLSQMASRQITFIDHLEKALMRIENKTYGICRVTGKLIEKARLRAVPHATLSMEAKLGQK